AQEHEGKERVEQKDGKEKAGNEKRAKEKKAKEKNGAEKKEAEEGLEGRKDPKEGQDRKEGQTGQDGRAGAFLPRTPFPEEEAIDEDFREIEEALWAEIDSMERRIRGIRERLRGIVSGRPRYVEIPDLLVPAPGDRVEMPASPVGAPLSQKDEARYAFLLKREVELERRLREVNERDHLVKVTKKTGEPVTPQKRGLE